MADDERVTSAEAPADGSPSRVRPRPDRPRPGQPRPGQLRPGRPWRVRGGLALIVVVFVVVASWNIGNAGYSGFYSSAARSMTVNWHAFWFGSFDPGGTITLDKLPGFLVPQVVSARLFGFHAWSLALPQVLEGVVTIVAVFVIGCRWRNAATGLTAATFFATTPLMVSMFGHSMEDGLLTMSLAVAFVAFQSALRRPGILPLVVSALWIAVGFQAKMLQAWLIVPALVAALLVAGGTPVARRVGRALVFAGVTVAGSLSWMVVVQLVPAASRPYFDGSTANNIFASVFGYNGVNRFVPGLVPGAAGSFTTSVVTGTADGASPLKLLLPAFTTQVGWLYPLAVLGVVLALRAAAARGGAARGGAARGVGGRVGGLPRNSWPPIVGLGGWLLTVGVVLSAGPVPHTAYFAALTVPVSVLAAVGVAEAIALAKDGRRGALVIGAASQAVWILLVLVTSGVAPPWLVASVAVLGVAATAGLARSGGTRTRTRTRGAQPGRARAHTRSAGSGTHRLRPTLAIAAIGTLLAPVVWMGSTLDPALAGTTNDAYAGPRTDAVPYFFQTDGTAAERRSFSQFAVAPPILSEPDPRLLPEQQHLVDYLRRHVRLGAPLFVTSSWSIAEPYILGAGLDVVPLGGYSGAIPSPTLAAFEGEVRAGSLRYVLLPTEVSERLRAHPTQAQRIVARVTATCTYVPDDLYEGATTLPGQSLWDCGAS